MERIHINDIKKHTGKKVTNTSTTDLPPLRNPALYKNPRSENFCDALAIRMSAMAEEKTAEIRSCPIRDSNAGNISPALFKKAPMTTMAKNQIRMTLYASETRVDTGYFPWPPAGDRKSVV